MNAVDTLIHTDGPEELDIRLTRGYVQVFLSDEWGAVGDSDGNWSVENSNVVCRQLGYEDNG